MLEGPRASFVLCDIGDVLFYDFPVNMAYSWYLVSELNRLGEAKDFGPWEILDAGGHWRGLLRLVPQVAWEAANHLAWERVLTSWKRLFVPIPGARDALARLGSRSALLANQPPEALAALIEQQWHDLVDAVVLDSMYGVAKPDPRLFQIGIEAIGASPNKAVMVGDRLDNDIIPARLLGMRAAWIEPFAYAPGLEVCEIPDAWRKRYERGRTARLYAQQVLARALPPDRRPTWRAESFAQFVLEWRE